MAILGGILLIIGAYFVSQGEVHKSMYMYLVADLVWISIAVMSGDIIGAVLITIGATLGFVAFLKMRNGTYNKTIKKVQ